MVIARTKFTVKLKHGEKLERNPKAIKKLARLIERIVVDMRENKQDRGVYK